MRREGIRLRGLTDPEEAMAVPSERSSFFSSETQREEEEVRHGGRCVQVFFSFGVFLMLHCTISVFELNSSRPAIKG